MKGCMSNRSKKRLIQTQRATSALPDTKELALTRHAQELQAALAKLRGQNERLMDDADRDGWRIESLQQDLANARHQVRRTFWRALGLGATLGASGMGVLLAALAR